MLFKKKDLSQIVAEEKILHCIEKEAEHIEKSKMDDANQHCVNIKLLCDAFASLNGW